MIAKGSSQSLFFKIISIYAEKWANMTNQIITPLCISKEADRKALRAIQVILDSPPAKRIGLCAFAQSYTIAFGSAQQDGTPTLLLRDPASGVVGGFDPAIISQQNPTLQQDVECLLGLIGSMKIDAFELYMLSVASEHLSLLAFPHLLIMQGKNVAKELAAITRYPKWMRATYATIVMPPSLSTHEAVADYTAVKDALRKFRDFHTDEIANAKMAGFTLGAFTIEEFLEASGIQVAS